MQLKKYLEEIKRRLPDDDSTGEFNEVDSKLCKINPEYLEVYLFRELVVGFDDTETLSQSHSFIDKHTGNIYESTSTDDRVESNLIRGSIYHPDPGAVSLNANGTLRQPSFSVIELVLSFGADITSTDAFGENCMFSAVKAGNMNVLEFLLSYPSTKEVMLKHVNDANSSGSTLLMKAAASITPGHLQILDLLLRNGADVNRVDAWGRTALHIACYVGNTEAAKRLLSAGISATIFDGRGKCASFYATPENCYVSDTGQSFYNPSMGQLFN